ncbi:GNAT family N-acetyltransferase [Brevibacillus sp. 7WMA2]|uniref:GNAT family N-acetyltransferase n=1 Tax=Brevibacillus TaxID=55080 RepID=UPI0003B20F77|nr:MULTISPECIES: GNAT family protein [Brevibacillus]ERM16634.1 N-acetyltransferase [Brevibacillus laterosporus PE36]MCR8996841.1 GNAT family N-acetyltransferase [Brevibacillus laterosporus]MDF9413387.1 N-acetyltransferase [Brevibacillus laterosporus]QIC07450.1 GNAT family N-acetyltransferase [Brevibacillus sp. 7WMA2]
MAITYWTGQKISLRALGPEDESIFDLLDDEILRNMNSLHFPRSQAKRKEWIEEQAEEEDAFRFIAIDQTNAVVGIIETFDCDRRNGTFDYYLAVFDPHRGKGYATEMIVMVMRFFFLELSYQKVNTTVYSFNKPSICMHEKLGFVKEGQLRNIIFTKGAYYDGICFGMTRQEFETLYGND